MITRTAHTTTYESAIERFRYEVTTVRLFGFIPLYINRREIWRKPGLVDDDTRALVFALDDWQCVYCGASDEVTLSIDHRIPQSQGGTSHITNLLTACKSCNSAKHDKTPEEARLSMTYGRFREHTQGIESIIERLFYHRWITRMTCDGIPNYPIYLLGPDSRGGNERRDRADGYIRRIYLQEKPHYVIRRCAWDVVDARLSAIKREESERRWRRRVEYHAWALKLSRENPGSDCVEDHIEELKRHGVDPDNAFAGLGIRDDFPPKGYTAQLHEWESFADAFESAQNDSPRGRIATIRAKVAGLLHQGGQ